MDYNDRYFKAIKSVCCVGCGINGVAVGLAIALKCPNLTVKITDVSRKRIALWSSSKLGEYDRLSEALEKCKEVNLSFSSEINECIQTAELILICVNTPIINGTVDLKHLESIVNVICTSSKSAKIIVETTKAADEANELLVKTVSNKCSLNHAIISSPLIVNESNPVNSILNAKRMVIQAKSNPWNDEAVKKLKEIYSSWIPHERILTAKAEFKLEMPSLLQNAYEYQKLSNNSITQIINHKVESISQTSPIDFDMRKQADLQNDVRWLMYLCEMLNLRPVVNYWNQVILMSDYHGNYLTDYVKKCCSGKRMTVCGSLLETKNCANSLELKLLRSLCKSLLCQGVHLNVQDQLVNKNLIQFYLSDSENDLPIEALKSRVEVYTDPVRLCSQSSAIVFLNSTKTNEIKNFYKVHQVMSKPACVFDFSERSVIELSLLKPLGFKVETNVIDFSLIEKLNSPPITQTSQRSNNMNETDMLIDHLLANEEHITSLVKASSMARPPVEHKSSVTPIAVNTDVEADTGNSKLIELLSSCDHIYDFIDSKVKTKQKYKFLAHVSNIYDLHLQLTCTECSRMYNLCKCSLKNSTRVELICKFLIDDHTGTIKVNYKNTNLSLTDKQFNIFAAISTSLIELLKSFGYLKLDSVPICIKYNENTAFSEIVSRRAQVNSDLTKDRIDFMKVVHDYLFNTTLNKYFLFEIPLTSMVTNAIKKSNAHFVCELRKNQEYEKISKHSVLIVDCAFISSIGSLPC